jgi:hypothetical protein
MPPHLPLILPGIPAAVSTPGHGHGVNRRAIPGV